MSNSPDPKVVWHPHAVERSQRETRHGHRGAVVWFTGLSGSGKSTIANLVDQRLFQLGLHTFLLDGDNVRHGLCAGPNLLAPEHGQDFANRFGLGFGPLDREENIRRVGCLAQLFSSAGLITLTAFVSPYRRDRERVRKLVSQSEQASHFIEVFVDTPLEICEQRDPKGLYQAARAGKIPHFTGISDPYEPPLQPELHLPGDSAPAEVLASQVVDYLQSRLTLATES